jgi:hypothetical protein
VHGEKLNPAALKALYTQAMERGKQLAHSLIERRKDEQPGALQVEAKKRRWALTRPPWLALPGPAPRCARCGKKLPKGAQFCAYCGAGLPTSE